jgi:hypothetical protein
MPIVEWNGTFLRGVNVAEYTAGRDKLIADGIIPIHKWGVFIMWAAPCADGHLPGTNTPQEV